MKTNKNLLICLTLILLFTGCGSKSTTKEGLVSSPPVSTTSFSTVNVSLNSLNQTTKNQQKDIIALTDNYAVFVVSNLNEATNTAVDTYKALNLDTGKVLGLGAIKNAIAGSNSCVVIGKNQVYFTYYSGSVPKTKLYCADLKEGKLTEVAILNTTGPIVSLKKYDDTKFYVFDNGFAGEKIYTGEISIFDTTKKTFTTLREFKTTIATDEGQLLSGISVDGDYLYTLIQTTKNGKSVFSIEQCTKEGKEIKSIDINTIQSFFFDANTGLYSQVLDFEVRGINYYISDYAGTAIAFSVDKNKLTKIYNGARLNTCYMEDGSILLTQIETQNYLMNSNGFKPVLNTTYNSLTMCWTNGNDSLGLTHKIDVPTGKITFRYTALPEVTSKQLTKK